MSDQSHGRRVTRAPITPDRRDIDAWRAQAEAVNQTGGVRLGDFDWPLAVLSLISEWEKNNASP